MAEEKVKKHFFKDMKKELAKVIWPTKKQTIKNTFAVIFIVLLVAVTVIALDEIFITANNFVVDKVTGGQISETKNLSKELERLVELHEQGKIDETTFNSLYIQAAYGMIDSATLKASIESALNGSNTQATTDDTTGASAQ
ncbi:MAG: preprotein translocase subunit SecE [Clostridiales bacterium]|nr:preprotein translocase subunit SecE [Clostridiales bacterium]